jgi:hypothetical protein
MIETVNPLHIQKTTNAFICLQDSPLRISTKTLFMDLTDINSDGLKTAG